jgi:DNA (cytosine-5)-methyltransferase 1
MLNFIDLFCGAGGLSCGLEMNKMKCLLGIDQDKVALETFRLNHRHSQTILGDLSKISTAEIKEKINSKKIDVICGGPPCQGFSTIGKNSQEDLRNFLFFEFVRVVQELKPDYIIMENVTGLLSKKNEATLQLIIKSFTDLGYTLDVRVLAAHHYGVPEIRRRTIILGNRFGVKNIYPQALFKDSIKEISNLPLPRTVGWAFENLIEFEGKTYNHEIKKAQITKEIEKQRISYIPEGKSVRYEKDQLQYLPQELWFEVNWQKLYEGRFREAKLNRLDRNKCANTINTNRTTYYHPQENRYLTAREAAAIQSFPANYIFSGTLAQQWRQIGNAVPPLLAKAIGEAILELDKNKDYLKKVDYDRDIASVSSKAFAYKNKEDNQFTQLSLFNYSGSQ